MKNKILTALVVTAMVFAAVSVLADDSDADSTGAISFSSTTVNEERTIQVTYTLSLTGADAVKPLKGYTVTWAVMNEGGTAASTDATIIGTASATTSVTDVSGKAYATLTGANVNANAKVTVKATVAEPAGGVSVTDVVSSVVTINDVATPRLGSWTVTEAEDFDDTDNPSSRMYVFQYTDDTLVIDTRYMTNLNGVSNVHIGLSWTSGAPAADTDYQLVNTIGVNDKLFIDLKNPKLTSLDEQVLWVKLFNYDGTAGNLTPLSKAISLTVNKETPASKLQLVPQYSNSKEGSHDTVAVEYTNLVRNETFVLDETVSVELLRAGYALEAWSHNSKKVDGFLNGDGSEDISLKALPIEEILMLATQASPVTADETAKTGDAPAYTDHKTNPITTLYGVWEKKFYTITYVDSQATLPTGAKQVEADDGVGATSPVADISGSTVIGGEETSFGVISVVKKASGVATDPQYTYMIQVMDENGTVIVSYKQAPIKDAAVQIDMVNNGTWKIHHVTQNLRICAVAIATDALETGVNFAVNYIQNDSGDKNGEARLTLDLNDYPNIANQEIYMKGTYYRVLSDLNGVRVYGNIENLTTLGDGIVELKNEDDKLVSDDAERYYTAYIDKVEQFASYEKKSGENWIAASAGDAPINDGMTFKSIGQIDNGAVYTTIGPKGYEYQGGHSYDLVLKTKAGTEQGLYIYGIQGVWDTDGQVWNAAGTALDDKTDGYKTYYTPWSIYEDNSDGA